MELSNNKEKEEILSQIVKAGKRTYFFDVKETKNGERYLTITESKRRFNEATGTFSYDKHKIFLYQEDMHAFAQTLQSSLNFIETGILPEPTTPNEDTVDFDKLDTFDFDIDQ